MGRLIWLMGPSGSGKDSLLSALRQQGTSAGSCWSRTAILPRAANAGSENHIALSEQEFYPLRAKPAGAELAR